MGQMQNSLWRISRGGGVGGSSPQRNKQFSPTAAKSEQDIKVTANQDHVHSAQRCHWQRRQQYFNSEPPIIDVFS